MEPKGYLPITFGTSTTYIVAGGPFVHAPEGWVGVNMAEEINIPALINVPTEDFSTPNMRELQRGVAEAAISLVLGFPVYIGCMGGIGRTGLFMACLAKVSLFMEQGALYRALGKMPPTEDVVGYVRERYFSHAVETSKQQAMVGDFPAKDIAKVVQDALRIRLPEG